MRHGGFNFKGCLRTGSSKNSVNPRRLLSKGSLIGSSKNSFNRVP